MADPRNFGTLDPPMKKGDTRELTLTAYYPEAVPSHNIAKGDPFPLTGKDVVFEARYDRGNPDPAFVKTNGDEGGLTVTSNTAEVELEAADTESMVPGVTQLEIDVRVSFTLDGEAHRWTVAYGNLPVIP